MNHLNYLIKQRQCTEFTSMIINGQINDLFLILSTVDSMLEVLEDIVQRSTPSYYVLN